jgi:predicted DNA-binding protein YlxM (UPF0122 family)
MIKKYRRMSVRTVKEICRLHFKFDISMRSIARACNISSSTVHLYISKLKDSGISYSEILEMSDDELYNFFSFLKNTNQNSSRIPIDFKYIND